MKALIPILAVVLAGCAAPSRQAFKEPPGWNPQPLAQRPDPVAQSLERYRRERAAEAGVLTSARNAYLDAHAELSPRDRELLHQGSYAIGWPPERVRASIGEPQRISETVSAGGRIETWSYRGGIELLQFVNGALATFHVER